MDFIAAYHRVLLPVSCISWKTGSSPGITVGTGATDEEDVGSNGVVATKAVILAMVVYV